METLAERESAMRSVLRHINETKTVKGLDQEQMKLLKECCDQGFLSGVQTETMISGRVIAECQRDVRLTVDGLRFLEAEPASEPDQTAEKAGGFLSAANDLVSVLEKLWLFLVSIFKFFKNLP